MNLKKYYKVNLRRATIDPKEYNRARDIKTTNKDIKAVSGKDLKYCTAFEYFTIGDVE